MAQMSTYSRNTKWLARLAGFFSFTLVVFVLLTIIDSVYQEPPFVEVKGEARIVDGINHKMVLIHRTFNRLNNNVSTLQGELRSEDQKYTLHLPDNTLEHSNDFYELVLIPNEFHGLWCIDAELRFSYRLSVRSHVVDLTDICVNVDVEKPLHLSKELGSL